MELLAVLRRDAGSFDAANTSHGLSRLAKMLVAYRTHLRRAGVLTPQADAHATEEYVRPCLIMLTRLVRVHIRTFEAWDVALCLWAYASMDVYDRGVFDLLCGRAAELIPLMNPTDCANILVAFGRFGHYHPEVLKSIPQVRVVCVRSVPGTCWGLWVGCSGSGCAVCALCVGGASGIVCLVVAFY